MIRAKEGQQKVPILRRTAGLCPSRSFTLWMGAANLIKGTMWGNKMLNFWFTLLCGEQPIYIVSKIEVTFDVCF